METPAELFFRVHEDKIDHEVLEEITKKNEILLEKNYSRPQIDIREPYTYAELRGTVFVKPFNEITIKYLELLGWSVKVWNMNDKFKDMFTVRPTGVELHQYSEFHNYEIDIHKWELDQLINKLEKIE